MTRSTWAAFSLGVIGLSMVATDNTPSIICGTILLLVAAFTAVVGGALEQKP